MDFHRRPGCPFQFLVRFSGSPLRIKHLKNSSHATSSAKSDQYSHTVQLKKRTIHTQKLAGSSPVVFAKKSKTKNIAGDVYTAQVESFTHGRAYEIMVSRRFLLPTDRILIIDDFLANGAALQGLIHLVEQAGATLVGAGIAVEKAFQPGGDLIRGMGVRVESLAKIKSMSETDGIEFC